MLKTIYNNLMMPISTMLALKKYGGIWGLKKHLAEQEKPNTRLIRIYEHFFAKSGSWIGYNSKIDSIPFFPHGHLGVFISGGAKLGKNVVIFQHVTIGSNTLNDSKKPGSPTIGDSVYIGAGAKIIGNVTIGDNCRIGANAVVYDDMPPHSVAVQAPTRIIQKNNLDNRFYSMRNGVWVYFNDGRWTEDRTRKP